MKKYLLFPGVNFLKKAFYILFLLMIVAGCEKNSKSDMGEDAADISASEVGEPSEPASATSSGAQDLTTTTKEDGSYNLTYNTEETKGTANLTSEKEVREKPKEQPVKMAEKIIREAEISVEVTDYNATMLKIRDAAKKWQGFVSDENEQNSPDKISNNLIIRVTSANFDELVADLTLGVKRVEYKRVTASDVTSEWVDITGRIKTKREVMIRYSEILKQAKTIEDILKVEENIRVIREEIEAAEGRLKYLNDRVSYSTINLNVWQEQHEKYIPSGQKPFLTRFAKAIVSGWKGIVSVFIALIYIWPFLLIFSAAYFLWKKKVFRVKK
jgi:hypothetical protein